MYLKILSTIKAIIIITICVSILSGCSSPLQVEKQEGSQASSQASIGELLKAVGPGAQVVQLGGGMYYSMAIVRDSSGNQTLWEIGNNGYGQLGLGNTNNRSAWQNSGLKNVTLVACGTIHSLCISDNYLWVTGNNTSGELGIGYTGGIVKKWTKTVYGNISALACGYQHSMFVSWGCLWVTGNNSYGQLGLDPNTYSSLSSWTQTQSNAITYIACGYWHSIYAGDNNVNLYVTGYNGNGQLGIVINYYTANGYTYGYIPRELNQWTKIDISNFKQFFPNSQCYITGVACGAYHSLISVYGPYGTNPYLPNSAWLWVTGDNSHGQLGLPTSYLTDRWFQLALGNIGFIACGAYHSMFTSGGNLWVSGANDHGQLGLGDYTDRYAFQQTGYGNIYNGIACGTYHSLFISQRQTWGAGSNQNFELGVPSLKSTIYPWFIEN